MKKQNVCKTMLKAVLVTEPYLLIIDIFAVILFSKEQTRDKLPKGFFCLHLANGGIWLYLSHSSLFICYLSVLLEP